MTGRRVDNATQKSRERLYLRPDPALSDEEGKRAIMDAFLAFFADQTEKDGNVETARQLRAKISAPGKPARRKKGTPGAEG